MKNKFFPEEDITIDDIYFLCVMIEKVSRTIKQRNSYTVKAIGYDSLYTEASNAPVSHCLSLEQVADEWITNYKLQPGNFDITDVDPELCTNVPSETAIGTTYRELIKDSMRKEGKDDYIQQLIDVYTSAIAEEIDFYNGSLYYESPMYVLECYYAGRVL